MSKKMMKQETKMMTRMMMMISFCFEEILDHEDNFENADSEAYYDPEITISEPIFDGSPLNLTMNVIAIITFAMTEHLSESTLAHPLTLIWLHSPIISQTTVLGA